jgi:hypothetical protein
MLGLVGATAMELRTAGVTPSEVDPLTAVTGSLAVFVVAPTDALVASPSVPLALLTVATAGAEEAQVTASVRSWLEPSV